ncbi:MAG: glycoside hydrolase family 127 protein [Alicyclobacillus sp.]|nr:glycoside hydrolase family 127 protein [Alicyclobacillus sp.]
MLSRKFKPVSFKQVVIDDPFFAPRIRINREYTIPAIYQHCQRTGRLDALKLTWRPGVEPKPHVFWDSDVAKWLEAACYCVANQPSEALSALIDDVVQLIASAQQPDGYLNSYFTVVEPGKRWTDLRDAHELYCAGHLMEAAVAHYEVTGKRTLLDVMCRYADHIHTVFGLGPGQKPGYCGHPEIELALVRLAHAANEPRYLELSKYFIDQRGKQPNYFDEEKAARNGSPNHFYWYFQEPGREYKHEYNQSHLPVREQQKVVGHAVRAMYLYSAMTDIAIETNDESLMSACERLFSHLTEKMMYVTGGIGSSDRNEGFTTDYDLPNDTAYCETCASIGLVFWMHRLLQVDLNGQYADVMERALYNSIASGASLDGLKFFYDNPLHSHGSHHRSDWFDVSCCPPNVSRLFGSLGQYVYSEGPDQAVVHLYIQGTGRLNINGRHVELRQITEYPWDGRVKLTVNVETPFTFGITLRIPGWCRKATLRVNNQLVEFTALKGYVTVNRLWQAGDVIDLDFDMPVERVYAHSAVAANRGRVAITRGPVVYCLEGVDNGEDLDALVLPRNVDLHPEYEPNHLGGIVSVRGNAYIMDCSSWGHNLYRTEPTGYRQHPIKAVPFCVWDNRDAGEMLVWIREGGT